MPIKAQAQPQGVTVAQHSQAVVRRYLHRELDPSDPQRNLALAGDQLWELLSKLRGAAGRDSEDAKAPLKAIRNAVEHHAFHGAQGADSPEVEALLQLYARLEELCQQRLAAGGNVDREVAACVQDALRYRLMRLVTGEAWDTQPTLKLRVLKLMFRFMVGENERLLAGAAGGGGAAPMNAPRRQGSFSKKAQAQATRGPQAASRWGEAINEVGRMQGSRVLPLLKACLLENLRLTTAAEAAAAARAPTALSTAAEAEAEAPPAAKPPSRGSEAGSDAGSVKSPAGTAPAPSPSRVAPASPATPAHALREGPPPPRPPPPEPEQGQGQAAPAFNVDDLLGLSGWVEQEGEECSSPGPEPAAGMPGEQLFAAFDSIGSSPAPAATGAPAGTVGGSPLTAGSAAPWAAQHPSADAVGRQPASLPVGASPGPRQQGSGNPWAIPQLSSMPPSTFASTSVPYAPPSAGAEPVRLSSSMQAGGYMPGGEGSGAAAMQLFRHNSNPDYTQPASPYAAAAADTSSVYFGVSNPFGDAVFSELAPRHLATRQAREEAAPPPGPPMRTKSSKSLPGK